MANHALSSLQREVDLDLPFQDVYHEAVLNVVCTASVLSAAGAKLFGRFGLTEAQFNVLLALKYRDRDLTQSDLGRRLVVTRASITSVLDRLEAKKLAARVNVPGNRRIFHVVLTDLGEKMVERVEPLYRDVVQRMMRSLSERDCRALIRFLERVRARAWNVQTAAGLHR